MDKPEVVKCTVLKEVPLCPEEVLICFQKCAAAEAFEQWWEETGLELFSEWLDKGGTIPADG